MRAVRRIKMFTILFSLVGISFTSCISDDNNVEPNKPVKIGDVVGSYSGKAFTLQGKWMNEQNTIFKINDSLIVFDNLPVRELVGSLVKDARKTEEILNKMDKVKYDLAYTSVIDETGTALILTMNPKELKFTIPMDDNKQDVVAHITTKYKGVYVSNRYDMVKFEWIVDKLTVDGKEDKDFVEVKYFFPGSVKR
ncbi:DUF4840 domain-containing protein [Myroides odoratimimus]|uniref:DUF4840 domain-containing protein n=1 Tax=Myroides odoratimimus TaxID=76832 RepID=UPI0009219FAD|nr:DUF4840 domain-containing protein [Myroides odoratimimus]SHL89008.1 protein of unknown function [Myroides odoratimimus subsp. xuanwuensis]